MKYPSLIICFLLQLCVGANAAAWWPQEARFGGPEYHAECLFTTAAGDDDSGKKNKQGEQEEEPDCE